MTIHDMLTQAKNAESLEIIDLPVLKGDQISFLRSKKMPEFAFVMWNSEHQGTLSQLVFDLINGGHSKQFSVVCACCATEMRGQSMPDQETQRGEFDIRRQELRESFKEIVVETATKLGITTLLMRRAHAWATHYGSVPGLDIIEAKEYRDAMAELYGRKVIQRETAFISDRSSGL